MDSNRSVEHIYVIEQNDCGFFKVIVFYAVKIINSTAERNWLFLITKTENFQVLTSN